MASAFYTLNSKYRISWECAELLIELGGGGAPGSATTSWNEGSVPPTSSSSAPLGFPFPTPSEVMGAAGLDKKRSRERALTLAGNETKPTPTYSLTAPVAAALCAPTSSMPAPTASNNNPSTGSTGRQDLSHRQLVLLREMLNNANATVDVAAEDAVVDAEVVVPPEGVAMG